MTIKLKSICPVSVFTSHNKKITCHFIEKLCAILPLLFSSRFKNNTKLLVSKMCSQGLKSHVVTFSHHIKYDKHVTSWVTHHSLNTLERCDKSILKSALFYLAQREHSRDLCWKFLSEYSNRDGELVIPNGPVRKKQPSELSRKPWNPVSQVKRATLFFTWLDTKQATSRFV